FKLHTEMAEDEDVKRLLEEGTRQRLQLVEDLIRLKTQNQALETAMEQVYNESETLEEYKKKWEKRKEEVSQKKITVKNQTQYKNVKKAILGFVAGADSSAGSTLDDDDEIQLVDTGDIGFSLYDPWTKALMRNPLRNKMCGHIYEWNSVLPLIKDNIGIMCPFMGCANKAYIQPGHLVEDSVVRAKLLRKIAELEEQAAQMEED
ncbi:hypothetical protein KR009_009205, partial [Drosophila setifemur]